MCFLEYKTFRGQMLNDYWVSIIDPTKSNSIPLEEFRQFIRDLVEGQLIGAGLDFISKHFEMKLMNKLYK